MEPGGVVIATMEGTSSTPMRTKLTLKGPNNNLGIAKYILTQQNLDKVKVYGSATGSDEVHLEKTYTSSEFGSSKTLYIESKPFKPTDPSSQTGTLKLEYQCQLNGNTEKLEDQVKVSLLPVEVRRDEEGGNVTWESLNGNMSKALPGQRMNLKLDASALPQQVVTVTDPNWSVTGGTFADYTATTSRGKKTSLEQADFDQEILHFYWSQPGLQTVTLNCKINGTATTFQTKINVVEPGSSITAAIGQLELLPDGTVRLMSLSGVGIDFYARVDSVATDFGAEGEWQFVQTLHCNDHCVNNQGVVYDYEHNGIWILDSRYPYNEDPDVYSTGQSRTVPDTPEVSWNDVPTITKFSNETKFKMYLMFKPPGESSKWVPLRVLDWDTNFEATKTNGTWSLAPNPNASATTPGSPTFHHPEWTIHFTKDPIYNPQ